MKIIIVGAGLVGSLCGCYFGLRGHEVHIYDYRGDPREEKIAGGRSINLALSRRGLEALSRVGLQSAVLEKGVPMKGRLIHPKRGKRKSILYDPVHNQCIYSVGRKELNEVLITEAENHENVFFHFNHKVTSVDFEKVKISYKRQDCKDSPEQEQHGDLIIGADGAYSLVRREMMKQIKMDFSQTYIDHGYIELNIGPEHQHKMEPNHLHIWPRSEFMLIALPNQDSTWTLTLFMPLKKFDELLDNQEAIKTFCQENFPDALEYFGESALSDYFVKPSYLISIKCSNYNVKDKGIIIGDAAHAIVPFYGQGMNAGFEDCRLLDELLHGKGLKLEEALNQFSATRTKNADAIYNLAMYNYFEMRAHVIQPSYILRNKLDYFLYRYFSNRWIPLYESITFTNIPYSKCLEHRSWQNSVIKNLLFISGIVISCCPAYLIWNQFH